MNEPTQGMRALARKIVRERWNGTFDGYPVEVEACAVGLAHAAALIEAATRKRARAYLQAGSKNAAHAIYKDADGIARGDWLKGNGDD